MGVTITKRGQPPRFNGDGVARLIKGLVPGEILRRTDQGIGSDGKPFAPYRPRYRKHLSDLGEDLKVDLRVSGGLMNSIKARGATIGADYVEVIIAPDTGTSPVWKKRKGKSGRASRAKGKQGPPHNVVGFWLHYGTPKMRARPFMGLTPEQTAKMWQMISRIMWRR
jgi:phage gpG-like protein